MCASRIDVGKCEIELDPLSLVHHDIDAAVEQTRERLHGLVKERGMPGNATAFRAFELEVFRVVLSLVGAVIAAVLKGAHAHLVLRFEASAAARASRAGALRTKGLEPVTVYVYGGVQVGLLTPYLRLDRRGRPGRRRASGRRGPNGSGAYPVLELLGFVGHFSPAVALEVARQVAECASFAVAQSTLVTLGLELDIKTMRLIESAVADIDLRLREEGIEQLAATPSEPTASGEFAGKRIVISVDGGRVRTREGGKCGRRRKKSGRRGFKPAWREPKAFVIHSIDAKGRKERKSLPVCDGTLGDANALFAFLIAELRRRGAAAAAEIVLTADGAHWIWERRERLAEALGLPLERIVEIVDFYHVVEKLADFSEGRLGSQRERERWLRRIRRWLSRERIDEIIAEVRGLAPRASQSVIGYLENNRARMRYREFRRRGLPPGSGAIESAIRRVVNQRIKGCGIFWTPENAERVLHLRAYLKAGRWEELAARVINNVSRRAA